MKTIILLAASALATSAASAVTIIGTVTGVDSSYSGTPAPGYASVSVGALITVSFDLPDPAAVLGSAGPDTVNYGVFSYGTVPLVIAITGADTTYSGSVFAFSITNAAVAALGIQGYAPPLGFAAPFSLSFTDPAGAALSELGGASLITYTEGMVQAGRLPVGSLQLDGPPVGGPNLARTILTFVIPEPGTASLAALSVAAVGARRRRRR